MTDDANKRDSDNILSGNGDKKSHDRISGNSSPEARYLEGHGLDSEEDGAVPVFGSHRLHASVHTAFTDETSPFIPEEISDHLA